MQYILNTCWELFITNSSVLNSRDRLSKTEAGCLTYHSDIRFNCVWLILNRIAPQIGDEKNSKTRKCSILVTVTTG